MENFWTLANTRAVQDVKQEFDLSDEDFTMMVMSGALRVFRVGKVARVPTVDIARLAVEKHSGYPS